MKQLLQDLRTGESTVWDVPVPRPGPNEIVVRNRASVISIGTERMLVQFAQRGFLGKARSRPDLLREALAKAKREGLLNTFYSIRNYLEKPLALGYSSAGEVIAVGERVSEYRVGDRVACAGGGFAVHAEAVKIPCTMAAHIPTPDQRSGRLAISFDQAAFTAIGSVALHGLRLASPQLGDTVAVVGLGLIGLLAVQLARAAGCCVVGTDPDASRCELARELGCERVSSSPEEFNFIVNEITRRIGVDVVLIAAATENSQPLELAGQVARDRACVVSIGATGRELPRRLFYEKEINFRVSRSYGPGRYDARYEQEGLDYPPGYVRWTEGRNLQAFLDQLSQGKIRVEPLISNRFPFSSAPQAYHLISQGGAGRPLGILLEYPGESNLASRVELHSSTSAHTPGEPNVRIGLLGAGNYVNSTLLAAMKGIAKTEMVAVCAASGASAAYCANKAAFRLATTDANDVITNPEVNTVVIATRHNLHSRQVIAALNAGKHVFCEKPLCLNEDELQEIVAVYDGIPATSRPLVMVGFNRRFAPFAVELRKFIGQMQGPLLMTYRVNAGSVPPSHWTLDPAQGGGRIIGEACHFIDLMTFLCGSQPVRVFATPMVGRCDSDNATVQVSFANGSTGVITYASAGNKRFSKERLEVFVGETVAVLDDFRSLDLISPRRTRKLRSPFHADKGHRAEWQAIVHALTRGASAPIAFSEIVSTTRTTFRVLDSLKTGRPEIVDSGLTKQGAGSVANRVYVRPCRQSGA